MKFHFRRCLQISAVLMVVVFCSATQTAGAKARERLLMDFGWRFHLGNEWGIGQNLAKAGTGYGPASVVFSDASWRRIDLPHDWAIELPFSEKADGSHGFKAIGSAFPENSVAWYRRTFDLAAEDGNRRLWLEFDGAFRDCSVFVNGWFVGHHESGYSNFRYDITDVANCGGKNVVSVKVDATNTEGWFYEGAGIYRHVWLVKTAPLAIAPDGVFVYSTFDGEKPAAATLHLETRITNVDPAAADVMVTWEIFAPNGNKVANVQQSSKVAGSALADLTAATKIEAPDLWSPETPRLYKLVTTVSGKGKSEEIDRVETEFGVRTMRFDVNKGFILNGAPYVIKGTCNHQDHAGVGAAMPDGLQYFRVAKLKEMGSNAYRTSHNPPTPELLEACDRLGMLVMDESRLLGSDVQNLDRWERLVRRDRNHASVVIWSIANEEFTVQATPAGRQVANTMQAMVKRLDPTRPVTYAAPVGDEVAGINEVIEVRGWNYHIGEKNMDAYHTAHPQQPNVGTEQGSTVGTRGIYANDPIRGYVSAYDDNAQSWSNTAEQWWSFFATRPWLSGGFVWTGFDYRGEPTPYSWPCINSHFGIFDTCGFPKDNFWYYQSWWTTKPVLHLLPHWNWAGREGQEIDVRALSNCDEVELLLNGQSLGRQAMAPNSELKWKVHYVPGVLAAKGFRNGKMVTETAVETTGQSAMVRLTPDRTSVSADGADISIVTVAVTDANGHVNPLAGNRVSFELNGPGRILGVGNGDPSCHEPDVFVSEPTMRTLPVQGWRYRKDIDTYASTLPEVTLSFDDSAWGKANEETESGPLGPNERGVFRASFDVSADDLAAHAVELWFGKIDGDGRVFVNGEKVGASGDPRGPSIYEVKSYLHAGKNLVAVALANYGAAAGVNRGVKLRLIGDAPKVAWSRSVFNGLAQIIVGGAKEAGEMKITARADGLETGTATIKVEPASRGRVVP